MKAFEHWAQIAKEDTENESKDVTKRFTHTAYKRCIEAYDAMLKAGIAPTDRVPERKLRVGMWSGAVEELRQKWCQPR